MSTNASQATFPPGDSAADVATDGTGWDRRRLLVVLAGVVAASILLVAGLGYAGWRVLAGAGDVEDASVAGQGSGVFAVEAGAQSHHQSYGQPQHRAQDGPGEHVRGQQYRDQVAAAPMLEFPASAAAPPTSDAAGMLGSGGAPAGDAVGPVMAVPTGVEMGPATVMTGFPRTPEGAVAQLAQIEVSVLQAMSLPVTAEVHAAWSLPGAVAVQQWALSGHVASFLAATSYQDTAAAGAGTPGAVVKDPAISVTLTPVGGLIKAVDGPDWVLACVLSIVSAVYQQHRETSLGHCERMQWAGGRWLIAAGSPPATAPSTWPETEAAASAGWRSLSGAPYLGDTGPGVSRAPHR